MSMLEKMSVQGIRSFGPQDNDRQVVKFFNPLTLILGPNGSGKTTIIECLRYVTTGDLPPNCGKGGSFVHDPKLAGDRKVKSQVKLLFRDVADKRAVITRSLVASQKLKQLQVNTSENIIQKIGPTGEEVTQNLNCAELNSEVPSCLGVSRAVLNNVIFCHQEESNWPLAEGKSVKAKFDEIFAATRYIKALENIRKIRKDLEVDIKVFKGEIVLLEKNQIKANQINEELTNNNTKFLSSKNRVDEIEKLLQPIKETLNKLRATEEEVHRVESIIESTTSRGEMDKPGNGSFSKSGPGNDVTSESFQNLTTWT